MYGQEAILLIELDLPSLKIAIDMHLGDMKPLEICINQLEKLDEIQNQAYLNKTGIQKWCKSYYDNKMKYKKIGPTDLVLLYDNRYQNFPRKFNYVG